jgi:hypothetical protein
MINVIFALAIAGYYVKLRVFNGAKS